MTDTVVTTAVNSKSLVHHEAIRKIETDVVDMELDEFQAQYICDVLVRSDNDGFNYWY